MPNRHLSHFFLLCVVMFGAPFSAGAQVVINEIAWMGTKDSASNEWVELASMGSAIDLTGWVLRIEGKKDIALSGSIASNGYYLIERTDDNTVPDVPADLINPFGGFLDSGAVLRLLDGNGNEKDRVDGSDGWKIGGGEVKGNKSTKETASRIGNVWVTATPTPRATNVASSGASDSTSEQETPAKTTTNTSNNSSFPVEPQIYASAGPDRTVMAGADVLFEGQALGIEKKPIENARFIWSFGDGGTKEGQNVLYRYSYPGEYIVVLDIASGKFSASDRARVRVIPASINITAVENGANPFVELTNTSQTELDISWWHLSTGENYFTIPKNTFISPNSSIRFAAPVTGLLVEERSDVALLYPNGELAYRYGQETLSTPVVSNEEERASTHPASIPAVSASRLQATKESGSAPDREESGLSEEETLPSGTTLALAASVSAPSGVTQEASLTKWILALFGVTFAGVAGVIFIRRKESDTEDVLTANDITIIE